MGDSEAEMRGFAAAAAAIDRLRGLWESCREMGNWGFGIEENAIVWRRMRLQLERIGMHLLLGISLFLDFLRSLMN